MKMATPYPAKLLLCIGNGDAQADQATSQIALDQGLAYHGVLQSDSTVVAGCWHTSVYDIKLTEIKQKLSQHGNCEIVVLDQPISAHARYKEYTDTIDMAQELARFYPTTFVNQEMSNPFRQILDQNKSFCVAPFNSLYVNSQGVKHCCWQRGAFVDYHDFYQDSRSQRMRELMLSGDMIPQCEKCYEIEKVGAFSPRQNHTLRWAYEMWYKSPSDMADNLKLVNYEINLGNKCNAMCRMCNPSSSHLIDKEYKKLSLVDRTVGTINLQNLNMIDLSTIRRLHVAGGESTISEEFQKFLQTCIDQKRTDFEIFVSTNAYALSKRFLNLIKHFSNIKFGISIDGYQDLNLYVRWPIKWNKFYHNVQTLVSILEPEQVTFNTVISIYNISKLYELYKFLDDYYPNTHCSMTFLTDPDYQVPWNFPDKSKVLQNLEQIRSLRRYQTDDVFRSKIDGLTTKISACAIDRCQLSKFFQFNDKLDLARGVKLKDFIPELEACRHWSG